MKTTICALIFLIINTLGYLGYCQDYIAISGKIIDQEQNPVEYANIYIKNTNIGTISNSEGVFKIHLPQYHKNDTLSISCIGFVIQKIPISSVVADSLFISLTPSQIKLEEVLVFADGIKGIVKKALEKISSNYPTTPSLISGQLQQTLKEDNKYVRLITAAINLYNPSFISNKKSENFIELLNAYASLDKKRKGIDLPFIPLYVSNQLFINDFTWFLKKNINEIILDFEGIIKYNDLSLYKINFSLPQMNPRDKFYGTIYIDKESLAFVSIRQLQEWDNWTVTQIGAVKGKVVKGQAQFLSTEKRTDYKKLNDLWVLSYCSINRTLHASTSNKFYDNRYEHLDEFYINNTENVDEKKLNDMKIINSNKDLYKLVENYNDQIWQNYNRILPVNFEKDNVE